VVQEEQGEFLWKKRAWTLQMTLVPGDMWRGWLQQACFRSGQGFGILSVRKQHLYQRKSFSYKKASVIK
jgi:hypothetical protein